MRCPVCGKSVAEERYEIHVGRHADVGAAAGDDAAPAELESVPATVGASTLGSTPAGEDINAGALLLGPEGTAMPLPDADEAVEPVEDEDVAAERPEGYAEPTVVGDADPTVVGDTDATVVEGEPESAAPAPEDDLDPTLVDSEAPADATAPLAVEAAAAWGAPPAPFAGAAPPTRSRSVLPIVGLLVLVVVAAIVVFVATRDDGKSTKAASRVKATPGATTMPTFGTVPAPGFPGATSPTPTLPPSPNGFSPQAPPLAVPPPAPGVAPPPGASPAGSAPSAAAGQIQISPSSAECDQDTGRLVVSGTVANQGSARYNVQFAITITSASGAPLGNAQTSVVVGPGQRQPFQATGTCSGPLGPGNRDQTQVQSITPA